MGRHPFGIALFIALRDVFFHFPHSQRRLAYYSETSALKSSAAKIRLRCGRNRGTIAADKVKRADGTSASADAAKKNAPYGR